MVRSTMVARARAGTALAAAISLGLAATAAAPGTAQTVAKSPSEVVQLGVGRGRLVNLAAPMSDLFVANDTIADVQVRSPTQLFVFGKKAGETTVYATTRGGAVAYSATIRVGANVDSLDSLLAMAMPDAKIQTRAMNGLVLLVGTVAAPSDVAEAERLVKAFMGEETTIVSRLRSSTPLQVNLQVKIAEVNRNLAKNIGANLATFDGTSGFKFGIGQGRVFGPQYSPRGPLFTGVSEATTGNSVITTPTSGTTLGLAGRLLGLDILGALDLGEQDGLVTTLASPNLTALSGETASFLAGGEIPIPVSQGLGAVSVEYKQYGVSLSFSPTVLADGRISIRVKPEVSQLTTAGAVTIGGTQIPALTTRRAETTVELGSGQSFMIGGLMQNTQTGLTDKAPYLGDVPVLGALFRSNNFRRAETELMIVVTPYLVRPVNAADIKLPTDGYRAPTDAERVLLGQTFSGRTGEQRPVPTVAPQGAAPGIVTGRAGGPAIPPATPTPTGQAKAPAPRKGSVAPGFSF